MTSLVHLASVSPRRRELLGQLGIDVQVVPAAVDEALQADELPCDYVRRLARAKAAAATAPAAAIVLAADTAVAVAGQILGKPRDAADAARMLALLSATTHDVWTAVAVFSSIGESVAISHSTVELRAVAPAEAASYWASGEPADKAGGYAIQGLGAVFVRYLRGSYSGVMGLPLFETAQLLAEHGIRTLAGGRG
ncbi:MAG: septum formation inhibitor Maf [Gammaproteobacteria bacterium]|nr:septum formation inhibitor Maf [Gammaproteobacteria bacterium]